MWVAKCYHRGCSTPMVVVTNDLLKILQLAAKDHKRGLIASGEVRWTVSR